VELTGGQFVGLRDALNDFNAVQPFEAIGGNAVRLADRADYRRFDALRKVHSQTFGFDPVDDVLHLLRCGVGFHYDHHGDFSCC